jgi:hypothetical protein
LQEYATKKWQYLQNELTDFSFKARFGNTIKFDHEVSKTVIRFGRKILVKVSLKNGKCRMNLFMINAILKELLTSVQFTGFPIY